MNLTSHPWAYPALEVLHLLGIGVLLGSLVLFELRLWGLGRALPLGALARLALPAALGGFAAAAAAGLVMFASQPQELLVNPAFRLKVLLLLLAGSNAAWFHLRGGLRRADALAKAQTALSLGLWLAVLVAGRWIAYV